MFGKCQNFQIKESSVKNTNFELKWSKIAPGSAAKKLWILSASKKSVKNTKFFLWILRGSRKTEQMFYGSYKIIFCESHYAEGYVSKTTRNVSQSGTTCICYVLYFTGPAVLKLRFLRNFQKLTAKNKFSSY